LLLQAAFLLSSRLHLPRVPPARRRPVRDRHLSSAGQRGEPGGRDASARNLRLHCGHRRERPPRLRALADRRLWLLLTDLQMPEMASLTSAVAVRATIGMRVRPASELRSATTSSKPSEGRRTLTGSSAKSGSSGRCRSGRAASTVWM